MLNIRLKMAKQIPMKLTSPNRLEIIRFMGIICMRGTPSYGTPSRHKIFYELIYNS